MKRIFVLVFIFSFFCINAEALFYEGAQSFEVRQIQKGLYRAGYYNGVWDGVYSKEVCEAVKAYQRDNGIFPDGICSYGTARALGAHVAYSKRDEDAVKLARFLCKVCKNGDCLTKLAVASVAVNRMESPLFPDEMSAVINTLGGAFPCEIPKDCMRASYEALLGAKPYGDITYFEKAEDSKAVGNCVRHGGFIFYSRS